MFLDAYLQLSTAQQVTADAVTEKEHRSRCSDQEREIATGEPMAMVVAISAIGTNTAAPAQVIESAAADLAQGTRILGEIDLLTADILAGSVFVVPLGRACSRIFATSAGTSTSRESWISRWTCICNRSRWRRVHLARFTRRTTPHPNGMAA